MKRKCKKDYFHSDEEEFAILFRGEDYFINERAFNVTPFVQVFYETDDGDEYLILRPEEMEEYFYNEQEMRKLKIDELWK